jgi:hypothetical protein
MPDLLDCNDFNINIVRLKLLNEGSYVFEFALETLNVQSKDKGTSIIFKVFNNCIRMIVEWCNVSVSAVVGRVTECKMLLRIVEKS